MHHWWRGLAFLATTGTIVVALAAGGCGSSSKGGGTSPTPTPTPTATAAPGELNLQIQKVDVPASGNPVVTFKATDKSGAPIDLIQEIKNGTATTPTTPKTTPPRFTLAQRQDTGDYVSAYETTATGKPYIPTDGATAVQPALPNAKQAVAVPVPNDASGLTSQGNGVYTFQLTAPTRTDLDKTKTWTAGMWATRTLAAQGDPGHPAHSTLDFVPNGGTPTTYATVTDQQCNVCHGQLEAHDRRTGTALCITCHSPQTTDPESGNTVDFKVMVHKIHHGDALPSVLQKKPYFIVGFAPNNPATLPATSVHDFSDVGFPRNILDCKACHAGGAQSANWNTAPSAASCTSCHDNTQFQNNAGLPTCAAGVTADCRHPIDITPTTNCANCHSSAELQQVHTNVEAQQGAKFKYEITSVTLGADRKPVVQFHVLDPTNGNKPYTINASGGGTADAPFTYTANTPPQSGASRLFVDIGWPSTSYSNEGSGNVTSTTTNTPSPGQPVQINALATATAVQGQAGVFQVTSPVAVPPNTPFTVVLEGHPGFQVNATTITRVPVTNDLKYYDASGGTSSAPTRRVVVDTAKCNACHGLLSAHGSNRTGNTQVCAVCHNPDATDYGQRKDAQSKSPPPPLKPEAPIDFKVLIHAVHGDVIRQTPYVVVGFGGSTNTFPIGFPNQIGNCLLCHTGTTYTLPLPAESRDTTVDSGADPANPADNVRIPNAIAACTACHDQVKFDNSATTACAQATSGPCNHDGGPQANAQSCAGCHQTGSAIGPDKVHPVSEPAKVPASLTAQ